jgi:phosphatidate phosphatase APP1
VFRERAKWFLVDNEHGKYVMTSLSTKALGPTEANGHAEGEFKLKAQEESVPSLAFTAVLPADDDRIFNGEVFLVEPEGVSVISDIDDTIKISEVTDKKKLLENTFLKPFQAVPGMVDAYKRLAAAGMVFHYVSSSPWQLYPPLRDFMQSNKYPLGSFHLRIFRVKDETVFNVLKSSEITKPPTINKLLADYPKREFILIGDSGEKDPEIYGKIARENSGRIRHIYIRSVTPETANDKRYKEAFRGLSRSLWTVFEDASVITSE